MLLSRTIFTAGAVLLVTLVACSGSSSSGGDACSDYYDALRSRAVRCSVAALELPTDRARFQVLCGNLVSAPGAENISGALANCTAQLNSSACGEQNDDCTEVTGTLADGAPCGYGFQCQGGSCKKPDEADCGTCTKAIEIGGDCTQGDCVKGASCLHTSTNGTNDKATCVAVRKAKAGESCADNSQTEIVICAEGLTCKGGGASSAGGQGATCQALGTAGSACEYREECGANLRCIDQKCAAPLAAGADCKFEDCGDGLGCDSTTKKCTAQTLVKAGAVCDEVHVCEHGRCNGGGLSSSSNGGGAPTKTYEPGTCVDPLPDGAACGGGGGSGPASGSSGEARCDQFAECVQGKCTVPNPATCK